MREANDEERQRAPGDRPVARRRVLVLTTLLPLGFVLQMIAARLPETTEAVYSRGLFPPLQSIVTFVAGLMPFSLGETMLVVLPATWLVMLVRGLVRWRAGERSLANLSLHAGSKLLITAGLLYAFFLGIWGFNYARTPFAESAGLVVRPASATELGDVTQALALQSNALRANVLEDEDGVMRLAHGKASVLGGLASAYDRVSLEYAFLEGRAPVPRIPLLSPAMTAFGITGIFWPFTGEPHVNGEIPDASFPFHACHEVAHQRGFAREDEANFIAYRACLASEDPDFQYAGTMSALRYALDQLRRTDGARAREIKSALDPGVRRDIEFIEQFWRPKTKAVQIVRTVSESTNHVYLKAQGQKDGTKSYGRMVDLLIADHRP
jgi:hypothetical protein